MTLPKEISELLPKGEDLKAELQAKVEVLYASANGTQVLLSHWMAEYAFLQLGYDVWEQAGATLQLVTGPSPRAAVANARAAFEAALDMLVMVAEPSLYDECGAFARVCEILGNDDLRDSASRAAVITGITPPVVGTKPADEVVAEEARTWEVYQPRITVMYQRVLAQAREEGRCKNHWSGLRNVPDRAEYVERKHGAPKGFKELTVMKYRHLTQGSHPGLRSSTRGVDRGTPGQITFGPKEGNGLPALLGAIGACDHAIHAFHLRTQLIR